MSEVKLIIEGMMCEGCVNRIKKGLSTIKGIEKMDISLEEKRLTLVVKKDKVVSEVVKQIENLGFQVSE